MMTREQFIERLEIMRRTAVASILNILGRYGVDVILAPGDGRMASIAALAGAPCGVVPLGFADFNGRPFGLNVLAAAHNEGMILEFMSAWEHTFPEARKPPPLLQENWDKL